MVWDAWSLWVGGGVALLILELFVPGFLFLGFGLAAVAMGAVLAFAPGLVPSLPVAALVMAVLAVVIWLVLRRVVGIRKGQTKIWHTDINED